MNSMTGSLEDKRKENEEKKVVRKVTKNNKCNVKPKEKNIENNYGKKYEEQYDTITEEEINRIKSGAFSLRMPDLSKILPEDHFINVYTKYASYSTDSYYEYHVMNGLWLLSTIAKYYVYFHTQEGIIRPNIWATNIGYSTISGRTTAYNKANDVYAKMFGEKLQNLSFSLEGYYCELRDNHWLDLGRDEAGAFYATVNKNYNNGFYPDACKIYDGESVKKRLKDKRGLEDSIETGEVCATELFNMTPQDLTEYITLQVMKKGYGFRRLYTFPTYEKETKGLFLHSTKNDIDFKLVCDCLNTIRKRFAIEARLSNEPEQPNKEINFAIELGALEYFNKINTEIEEKYGGCNKNDTMLGAWGRYKLYAIKLAMLIEFGKSEYSDIITLETMKLSLQLITKYFLPTFKSLVELIEEDTRNNSIENVLSILKSVKSAVSRNVLWRESKLTERVFDEVIDTLIKSDSISAKIEERTHTIYYILKTDEDRKFEEENLDSDKENILDKLRKKGNSAVWNDVKRSLHLDKSRFDKAINILLFEGKIKVEKERVTGDKPRSIISLIN